MEYPVRCVIIDIGGQVIDSHHPSIVAKTPDISKPHIGKRGLAELVDELEVKITLDDGNIIYGYDCWWIPEEEFELMISENIRKRATGYE